MFELWNDQGRTAAAKEIKKALCAAPTDALSIGAHKRYPNNTDAQSYATGDRTVTKIRKLHAGTPQLEIPSAQARGEFFRKQTAAAVAPLRNSAKTGTRLTKAEMLAVARDLRKALPPQSRNGVNSNALADTGTSNVIVRQPVPDAKPTMFGPRSSAAVSNPKDLDPTLKALREIYSNGPLRMF